MFLSFVNYIRLNVNEAFTPKKLLDFFSFNKSRNVKTKRIYNYYFQGKCFGANCPKVV